jgi:L-fucose isomerase-like protein
VTTTAVVALARVTFDQDEAARQVDLAWNALERAGLDLVGGKDLVSTVADIDDVVARLARGRAEVLVVLQATFADASMIIRLDERFKGPLVCWSFPEPRTGAALRLNSMCGANLAAYSLRRRGSSAVFVHAEPGACDSAELVRRAITDAQAPMVFEWPGVDDSEPGLAWDRETLDRVDGVVETLADAPIGVIGEFPDGFEPCSFDPATVAELTGARTDAVPLTDLFDAADDVDRSELLSIRQRVDSDLRVQPGVADLGLERSLRLYGGLRRLTGSRGWRAVATRCWPECTRDYGGAACAPQAMLAADGIPAMCEADVYGGLTALILRTIAGEDPFVADVVDADRSDGTSAVWHCGQAPITLADPTAAPQGISHPMQGKALLHEFALRPGRVTVARLSQAGGRASMVIGGAELVQRPRAFAGTCGVLRWDRPIDDVMRTIFDFGLEHHVGIVSGDHRDVLVALAARWGIPVLRLGHDHGARSPAVAPAGADVGP